MKEIGSQGLGLASASCTFTKFTQKVSTGAKQGGTNVEPGSDQHCLTVMHPPYKDSS